MVRSGALRQLRRRLRRLADRATVRLHAWNSLGARGERAAGRLLRRKGWTIIGRQVRLPHGELDLVAVDGETVVFVEVKTRRGEERGRPDEAVGPAKQRKLTALAVAYLRRHELLDQPARFDVIAVHWPSGARRPQLQHFRDAFEARGAQSMYA